MARQVAGAVLAAGAGRRAGGPKALRRKADGTPWVEHAASVLREAGCDPVIVVLGAQAFDAELLVPDWADTVVAWDWSDGQAASLRTVVERAAESGAEALLVTLVDLPGQTVEAARRVIDAAEDDVLLARATFDGAPGHPVLISKEHWVPMVASLTGDSGARDYLAAHETLMVDCTDLAGGTDVDD
ncbi:nucleotidyltransferase family protein [Demequina zhanjiangensis]|uniref:NTP transferase domain-containing protein n=1 Tax=Demequina zhanjiangensis TaxID=3051659 RepID=A0ABT8FYD9_9MICO|nr:NTP transferase domain-containing protein [Demequina sp. SYSU T00b26]MDN4471828.1 NTP transferase domain-containing protein [Demequina sp. SYSU T00b26]